MSLPFSYWNLAEEVRVCVCDALKASAVSSGTCGCPCRSMVAVGAVSWDDCCEGQMWVALDRAYIHANFPQPSREAAICQSPVAVELSVGILRCAPTLREDGSPPTSDQISESARTVYEEARVVLEATLCCLQKARRQRKFYMSGQTFLGPQGGCVGSLTKFVIELQD